MDRLTRRVQGLRWVPSRIQGLATKRNSLCPQGFCRVNSDCDGTVDTEENLATLDTVADYPHNGLSGMAWDPNGGLVFSLGENFGKDWSLTGTDGAEVSVLRGF